MATITIREYERAVRLADGRVRGVLGPGRHRHRAGHTELHRVDVRPRLVTVPGQEMLTTDGIAVRVTAVLRIAVSDPVTHLTASQDGYAEVYAAAQQALRAAVEAALPCPEVVVDAMVPYDRGDLVARVHERGQVHEVGHTATGTRVRARVDAALAAALGPYRSDAEPSAADGEAAG